MDMGPLTLVSLVAHQGGWDEVLLVGGPLAVIAAALWARQSPSFCPVE